MQNRLFPGTQGLRHGRTVRAQQGLDDNCVHARPRIRRDDVRNALALEPASDSVRALETRERAQIFARQEREG